MDKNAKKPSSQKINIEPFDSFMIRSTNQKLYIRTGPSTEYSPLRTFLKPGNYTIVALVEGPGSASGWGLLKDFQNGRDGWISLDCVERV